MQTGQIFKILTLIVVSCHALPTEKADNVIVSKTEDIVERMKDSKSIDDKGFNETLRVKDDPELIEGDMVLRRTYNGAVNTALRWPNAVVYYKLSPAFRPEHVRKIFDAMRIIETRSCVSFQFASATTRAFILISGLKGGCYSEIGYKGSKQVLNLDLDDTNVDCFRIGRILHELLHALGFYHQHNVPERDNYIKVNYENIMKENHIWFQKDSDATVTSFGVKYDYHSVMHYGAKDFSKNGKDTITILNGDGHTQIGQRNYLSDGDAKKLNLMYNCPPV